MTNNYTIIAFLFVATPTAAFVSFVPVNAVAPCKTGVTSLFAYAYSSELDVEYGYEDAQMPMLRYENEPYDNLLQRMRLPDTEDNESVVVRRIK